jgi:hypothetical protein
MPRYAIDPGAHIDVPLSNYLAGWSPKASIADLVCPVIPVRRRSDRFYEWTRSSFLRSSEDQRRARGTAPKVVEPDISDSAYLCTEYELATVIEDQDYANTDSMLRLEQSKATYLYGLIRMAREIRVANKLRLAASGGSLGTSGSTLSGTDQWNHASFTAANLHRDIILACETIRLATGYDPNTVIIPKAVAAVMVRNSDIKTMISYEAGREWVRSLEIGEGEAGGGYGGDTNRRYLPSTLWGLKVLEPSMIHNTAAEGVAESVSDVWGDDVRILYVNEGLPSMDVPSCSYTFRSTEYGTAGINVRRWREEAQKANYLAVGVVDDERVISDDLGYVIADTLA